jgi:protein arginine kinase activator
VGKSPHKAQAAKAPKKKAEVTELRLKLQKAIEQEAFEEAARLRDQIRDMEKK